MKGKKILSEYSKDVRGLLAKYDRSIKLVGVYSVFYDPESGAFLITSSNPENWDGVATKALFNHLLGIAFEKGWVKEGR